MANEFREKVFNLVSRIPEGRVMTYGQLAVLCGKPRAARIVGQIAHFGDQGLHWHRVVRKDGGLASGFPGGMQAQKVLLEAEGLEFDGLVIRSVENYLFADADLH